MKRFSKYIIVTLSSALILSACSRQEESAVETAQTTLIASINGEYITQADFELSETWLPDFVRETDASDSLNMHRYGALVEMMLLAQEAKKENMMTDAERSLLIKEAQANVWLDALPLPEIDLSDATLDAEIANHPEKYINPARYTVDYALIHTEQSRQVLAATLGLMNGAQMGYNFVDPPELPENPNLVAGLPRTTNEKGHPRSATFFNFAFVNAANQKANEACHLGPFSASDNMLFSCDKAIAALNDAPIGNPLQFDISCDPEWKAFVIPSKKEAASIMDPQTAKLHARQNLIEQARKEVRQNAILGK